MKKVASKPTRRVPKRGKASFPEKTERGEQGTRAVITVVGGDHVGIVARVTAELADCGANIIDLRSTLMEDLFTMIILTDISDLSLPFEEMQQRLEGAAEELHVQVRVQHEAIFRFMHRV